MDGLARAHGSGIRTLGNHQATNVRLVGGDNQTKLGVVSRINYASPREISMLITDTGAAELPALKELKDILPKVVLA